MLVEEHENSVLYRSEHNPYFKIHARLFPALDFLVQLLQHLPDPRAHLVRRYARQFLSWLQDHRGEKALERVRRIMPTSFGFLPRDSLYARILAALPGIPVSTT